MPCSTWMCENGPRLAGRFMFLTEPAFPTSLWVTLRKLEQIGREANLTAKPPAGGEAGMLSIKDNGYYFVSTRRAGMH